MCGGEEVGRDSRSWQMRERECVCVCVCVLNLIVCPVLQGDVKSECGARAVYEQVTADCTGLQHVIASIRGEKAWWQVWTDRDCKHSFSLYPSTFQTVLTRTKMRVYNDQCQELGWMVLRKW